MVERQNSTKTIAQKLIDYNKTLHYSGNLPEGFHILNPFVENPETMTVMSQFYRKYYDDTRLRRFIIGINPSRHGAGVTGVPFTDTKRLKTECGIVMQTAQTHEVSSVFFYDMIKAYGGPDAFYHNFYINSPFPLAIVRSTSRGQWLNANYYDDKTLFDMVSDFMIETMQKHINIGLITKEVFVLGKKNADHIEKLNARTHLFDKMTVLEHPRYIQQYKSKEKDLYIDKYLQSFYFNEL